MGLTYRIPLPALLLDINRQASLHTMMTCPLQLGARNTRREYFHVRACIDLQGVRVIIGELGQLSEVG